ncbi:MAG: hypothetical protein KTR30_25720 [Saprospiraceae bacterium]|nr:hypothetical protein [Saprospiraceae bacterium]
MANTRSLRGKVYDKTSQARYIDATVKLEPVKGVNGETTFVETDRNGEFTLDLSDEQKFPEGDYTLAVYHDDAVMEGDEPTIAVPMVVGKNFNNISMLSRDQFSQNAGIAFGSFLVILLLAVSGFYSYWHIQYPVPLDSQVAKLVEMLEEYDGLEGSDMRLGSELEVSVVPDSSTTSPDSITLTATVAPGNSFVMNTLDTMRIIALHTLEREKLDSSDFGKAYVFLIDEAQRAAQRGNEAELKLLLKEIREESSRKPNNFFWDIYPMRMLEILLWALLATLLRLIVNTGYYLFRKRFIKSGIYHSLGLIFTVPILALLLSIVLSFVKINIAFGEAELNLDLTNIYISILVATFIGLSPWKAWDYLNDLADSLFKRLSSAE